MSTDISSVIEKFREEFTVTDFSQNYNWDVVSLVNGASIDLSVPSVVRLLTGTTAGAEAVIRSKKGWVTSMRAVFLPAAAAFLSQRIANQEFELRLTDKAGNNYVSFLFDGTSATTAKMRSRNGGMGPADTNYTVLDTATGSGAFELEMFPDETYWHNRAADNVNARVNSQMRNRQIPDPNIELYLEIRAKNTGTAASSTTLSLDGVLMQDINELTTQITGGQGAGAASQALPVTQVGTGATQNVNVANNATLANVDSETVVTSTLLAANANTAHATLDSGGTNTSIRGNKSRIQVQGTAAALGSFFHLALEESEDNTTFREVWRSPFPNDGMSHTAEVPLHARYRRWRSINGATAQTSYFLKERVVRSDGAADIDKNLSIPLTPAAGQALAASAVFTSPTIDLGANHMWERVRVAAVSDQVTVANGYVLQHSMDGSTWFSLTAGTLGAGQMSLQEQAIFLRYIRLQITNSTTAASALRAVLDLVSL